MTRPIVVFDLDGTLVESAYDLIDSLNYCLTQEGLKTYANKDVQRLVGLGGRIMIERALTFQNVPFNDDKITSMLSVFLKNYEQNMPGKTVFFPQLDKALDNLSQAGFLLAVCTNKHEKLAQHLLNSLGEAKRFATIVGGDTFSYHKPDPRHIISTIEQAGGDFAQSVMVGDSRADILAAQAADIPVIAVDFGYTDQPVQTFKPTKVISHFSELTPELIKECLQ